MERLKKKIRKKTVTTLEVVQLVFVLAKNKENASSKKFPRPMELTSIPRTFKGHKLLMLGKLIKKLQWDPSWFRSSLF